MFLEDPESRISARYGSRNDVYPDIERYAASVPFKNRRRFQPKAVKAYY